MAPGRPGGPVRAIDPSPRRVATGVVSASRVGSTPKILPTWDFSSWPMRPFSFTLGDTATTPVHSPHRSPASLHRRRRSR